MSPTATERWSTGPLPPLRKRNRENRVWFANRGKAQKRVRRSGGKARSQDFETSEQAQYAVSPSAQLVTSESQGRSKMGCLQLLLLSEFDLKYVTRKSVKGRVVAEFLADHPVEGGEAVEYLFPDEAILHIDDEYWTMYFDGASNQYGYGIGVLLIAPDNSCIPLAFKLRFKVSNYEAEYEACIAGLEAALELGSRRLDVIGDSNLVVSQANGDWKVKEEKMMMYHQTLDLLIPRFEKLNFVYHPRENNRFANSLATLSSMIDNPFGIRMRPVVIDQKLAPAYESITAIDEVQDENPWYYDIWNFLEKGMYLLGATAKDK